MWRLHWLALPVCLAVFVSSVGAQQGGKPKPPTGKETWLDQHPNLQKALNELERATKHMARIPGAVDQRTRAGQAINLAQQQIHKHIEIRKGNFPPPVVQPGGPRFPHLIRAIDNIKEAAQILSRTNGGRPRDEAIAALNESITGIKNHLSNLKDKLDK